AQDKATNKVQSITITASSGLSKDEVEKMKKEAESHAAEDKVKKEEIETRNNAESIIFSTERILEENKDKVPEDVKKEVTDKLEELKKVKDGSDLAAIKKVMEEMNKTVSKIGQAMYQQANAQQTASPDQSAGTADPQAAADANTVDGQYEEVKK
ncbi:MAG: molecular chaperone DnaK, partial [Candidatus Komeilibacteria bacterium CG_4_9_14_3_um_filter_37_5]